MCGAVIMWFNQQRDLYAHGWCLAGSRPPDVRFNEGRPACSAQDRRDKNTNHLCAQCERLCSFWAVFTFDFLTFRKKSCSVPCFFLDSTRAALHYSQLIIILLYLNKAVSLITPIREPTFFWLAYSGNPVEGQDPVRLGLTRAQRVRVKGAASSKLK